MAGDGLKRAAALLRSRLHSLAGRALLLVEVLHEGGAVLLVEGQDGFAVAAEVQAACARFDGGQCRHIVHVSSTPQSSAYAYSEIDHCHYGIWRFVQRLQKVEVRN